VQAAIVLSSREVFGSDRAALRLAHVLEQLGAGVRLVVPRDRPERGLAELAAGYEVVPAPVAVVSSRGVDGVRALRPRRPLLTVDVVVANTTAVVAAPIRAAKRIQIVREWFEPASVRHRVLGRYHASRADALVGISNDVLRQWQRSTRGPARRHLVHDWLDEAWLADEPAPAVGREGQILFLGRFNDWKGQDVLAQAYEQAFGGSPERPALTFRGAEGPDSPFHDRAERLRARGSGAGWQVLPLTADPRTDLARAALLVVPSLRPEPFGLVVLEGLAMGCRVLTFDGGGPRDLAPDFPGALSVVPRSTGHLAEALVRWWRDGGTAQDAATRRRTRTALDARYSPGRALQQWRQVLDADEQH
jgi:glycosyltransferase involved in cell wall biosynthesis